MFVGVGASRVRDLFKQAREKAPEQEVRVQYKEEMMKEKIHLTNS